MPPETVSKEEVARLVREVIDQRITERFEDIGIDSVTFQGKRDTIANNTLLNNLRLAKERRSVSLDKGVWGVAQTFGGYALWALALAVGTWLLSLYNSIGPHK